MRLIQHIQGTPEWLAWRRDGIGGSDVANLLGVSPFDDATPECLFAEKVFGHTRPTNFAMRRGNRLEPVAREWFERKRGHKFPPVCVEHSDASWMRASLDGLAYVPGPGHLFAELAEIKAPNWKVHDAALAGFVPDYYRVQVQWQLLVTGAELCWFVSVTEHSRFLLDQQLAVVKVYADAEEQARLHTAAEAFWGRVLAARSVAEGVPA